MRGFSFKCSVLGVFWIGIYFVIFGDFKDMGCFKGVSSTCSGQFGFTKRSVWLFCSDFSGNGSVFCYMREHNIYCICYSF